MREADIVAGKVYGDSDGLLRYVMQVMPADGRKMARVKWRRPGEFASMYYIETMRAFLRSVTRIASAQADPVLLLPNDGMAECDRRKGEET